MYTDKKNILQLVALLEAHGITKVVLCPGSRNAPIVHTLSNRAYVEWWQNCCNLLYFRYGVAESSPGCCGSFLSECSFGCHFCGSSRCLDRADGRTDFAAA